MRRLTIFLILACVGAGEAASAEAPTHQSTHSDSVRSVVLDLLADCRYQRDLQTPAGLDMAISLVDSAISMARKQLGESDSLVAHAYLVLSTCYWFKDNYRQSEAAAKTAVEIYEQKYGPQHPKLAAALRVLSDSYLSETRYAEAQILIRRSIEIYDANPEADSIQVSYAVSNLGHVYKLEGKYREAIPLYERSLKMNEAIYGRKSRRYAGELGNLGLAYYHLNELDAAQGYLSRSLAVFREVFGDNHPKVGSILSHLAKLFARLDQQDSARAYAQEALTAVENSLGAGSAQTVGILHRLITSSCAQGRLDEALGFAQRARLTCEKLFTHPNLTKAGILSDLARIYESLGQPELALKEYEQSVHERQRHARDTYPYASESQKLRYARLYPLIDHAFIQFAIRDTATEPAASALEMIARSKSAVIDALAFERELSYCSEDKELSLTVEQHGQVSRQIAAITLQAMGSTSTDVEAAKLNKLYHTKDELETQLSRACAEFTENRALRRFTIDDLTGSLPNQAMLWEYISYRPFAIEHFGSKKAWGTPRYAGFCLRPDGTVSALDLGEAKLIDSLIALSRIQLAQGLTRSFDGQEDQAEADLKVTTRKLFELLIAPLEKQSDTTKVVYIAPYGKLNLLPFEILVDGSNRYLIENYEISYLSSGRDLLRFDEVGPLAPPLAVIMADPDFMFELGDTSETTIAYQSNAGIPPFNRGLSEQSGCLSSLFRDLPATMAEGDLVQQLMESSGTEVLYYSRNQASESTLENLRVAPSLLHLATHGYFCSELMSSDAVANLDNPLIYSGLAMAGANRMIIDEFNSDLSDQDGILTSLEVSALNLVGTDLVVLSACQSGVGEVMNGEGVFGLRRTFQHAGARSIIMSMFDIPDQATVTLMEHFYTGWIDGRSKSSALRTAALSVLNERRQTNGVAHPVFWGGFVLFGDPN